MNQIGLSASTIASSFGKVTSANKDLEDYKREDIALSLLRMISYNIAQVLHLNLSGSKVFVHGMVDDLKYCNRLHTSMHCVMV